MIDILYRIKKLGKNTSFFFFAVAGISEKLNTWMDYFS